VTQEIYDYIIVSIHLSKVWMFFWKKKGKHWILNRNVRLCGLCFFLLLSAKKERLLFVAFFVAQNEFPKCTFFVFQKQQTGVSQATWEKKNTKLFVAFFCVLPAFGGMVFGTGFVSFFWNQRNHQNNTTNPFTKRPKETWSWLLFFSQVLHANNLVVLFFFQSQWPFGKTTKADFFNWEKKGLETFSLRTKKKKDPKLFFFFLDWQKMKKQTWMIKKEKWSLKGKRGFSLFFHFGFELLFWIEEKQAIVSICICTLKKKRIELTKKKRFGRNQLEKKTKFLFENDPTNWPFFFEGIFSGWFFGWLGFSFLSFFKTMQRKWCAKNPPKMRWFEWMVKKKRKKKGPPFFLSFVFFPTFFEKKKMKKDGFLEFHFLVGDWFLKAFLLGSTFFVFKRTGFIFSEMRKKNSFLWKRKKSLNKTRTPNRTHQTKKKHQIKPSFLFIFVIAKTVTDERPDLSKQNKKESCKKNAFLFFHFDFEKMITFLCQLSFFERGMKKEIEQKNPKKNVVVKKQEKIKEKMKSFFSFFFTKTIFFFSNNLFFHSLTLSSINERRNRWRRPNSCCCGGGWIKSNRSQPNNLCSSVSRYVHCHGWTRYRRFKRVL